MRNLLPTIALSVVTLSNASAALVDNGSYTSDPLSGLDWMDLTVTLGQNRTTALSSNYGWRYPTNSEIENLFWQSFDGYYETNSLNYSSTSAGAYADQAEDMYAFGTLFGTYDARSIGLYADEDGVIRLLGVFWAHSTGSLIVYGPEFTSVFDNSYTTPLLGIYLVRASVPVPPAVWLFGSALGVMGWMRRRHNQVARDGCTR